MAEHKTRQADRPAGEHVAPVPPAAKKPADDPAWAFTLTMAELAREARSGQS